MICACPRRRSNGPPPDWPPRANAGRHWRASTRTTAANHMMASPNRGLLILSALPLLIACAGPRVVTVTEIVEVPAPYRVPVPDERTEPLAVPVLPAPATNSSLAETLAACYEQLHTANEDRGWLRAVYGPETLSISL